MLNLMFLGVFFEMMTTDMRKKLPETIYDLKEKNFTIIYMSTFKQRLQFLTNMIDENQR